MPKLDILNELFNEDKYEKLIKSVNLVDTELSFTLLNDINIIINTNNFIDLNLEYNEISLDLSINLYDFDITYPTFNDSSYTKINDIYEIIKNVYDYVMNMEFNIEINGNYQDIEFNGYINYKDKDFELYATADILGVDAKVMIKTSTVYIIIDEIKLKVDISNYDEVKNFIKNTFNYDIDNEIERIKNDYGFDINNIISFIDGSADSLDFDLNATKANIDLGNILNNINLLLNNTKLIFEYDSLIKATALFKENMISNVTLNYNQDLEIFAKINNNPYEFVIDNEIDYLDAFSLISYGKKLVDYVSTKKLDITATVKMLDNNNIINGELQLDFASSLLLSAIISSNDIDNMDIKAYIQDGMLYVDYNGLCIKMDNNNFKELLYIVLEFVGINPSAIPFMDDVSLDVDVSQFKVDESSITLEKVVNIIKYFKGLTKVGNDIILTLDNTQIYNNSLAKDMKLVFSTDGNKVTSILIKNAYLSTGDLKNPCDITITFNDWSNYNSVDLSKNYVDISGSNELVKAFFNMSNEQYFHINGDLLVKGKLLNTANISKTVGLDIKIKVVDKLKIELYGQLGEIPALLGVNNDVPYKVGDTESGSNRYFYFYYKDGKVYMYRSETVDQVFGLGDPRLYQKCVEVSLETLLADPMSFLQYAVGFTSDIMDAINNAMEKTKNRTSPIDYSNIIKGFDVLNNGMNYNISINMAEITANSDIDTLTLNIGLGKYDNGKNYLSDAYLNVYMPLADAFKLTLETNNLRLVDFGQSIDMSKLYDYVDYYQYGEGEYWHKMSKSDPWELVSDTKYTLKFVTNNNQTINNIVAKPGIEITIPTLADVIVDDGITRNSTIFRGWYTTSNFALGTEFVSTTMPGGDKVLYAKWENIVETYRKVHFETDSDYVLEDIIDFEGQPLNLKTLMPKTITSDRYTEFYNFLGWYDIDGNLCELKKIPAYDLNLYAHWEFDTVELSSQLVLYDLDQEIFRGFIKVGSQIELTGIDSVNIDTKFYFEPEFITEYNLGLMPNEDLCLYVRNKYNVTFNSTYGLNENNKSNYSITYSLYYKDSFELPTISSYIEDDGKTRKIYTFNGYSSSLRETPHENITIEANWTKVEKKYYTIKFDKSFYSVKISLGIYVESLDKVSYSNIPDSIKVLEGEQINLSNYYATGSKKNFLITYNVKSNGWSTESNGNGTHYNGMYTVTENKTLYMVWVKD